MLSPLQIVIESAKLPFRLLAYLFMKNVLISQSGASFASKNEASSYLSPNNKGLLVDGNNLRLSKKDSFSNVCVIAKVGRGKTAGYIAPVIFDHADRNASLVVNDPSGELFELTSGIMEKRGYRVIYLNPDNLAHSHQFNPLNEAQTDIDIDKMADLLVQSGLAEEDFWSKGCTQFASLFLKCLRNAQRDNPDYYNLGNLHRVFQKFGSEGEGLTDFINKYTIGDDPLDDSLLGEWKKLTSYHQDGIQSLLMTSSTALRIYGNSSVKTLTARSDFKVSDLRKQKTIVYFSVNSKDLGYYSSLVSIFFQSIFNGLMRDLPKKNDLPVYVLFDEFGHAELPSFATYITTMRKYHVSVSVVLQSIKQLNKRYGEDAADSILGGFAFFITYSGSDNKTAQYFEDMIGKVREKQKRKVTDIIHDYREFNLIHAAEIRQIEDQQQLIVSSNKKPLLLKNTRHYQNPRFSRMAKVPPVRINNPNPKNFASIDINGEA